MTTTPPIETDVYDYLMGDGFVVVGRVAGNSGKIDVNPVETSGSEAAGFGGKPRDTWPDIEADIAGLERLLK